MADLDTIIKNEVEKHEHSQTEIKNEDVKDEKIPKKLPKKLKKKSVQRKIDDLQSIDVEQVDEADLNKTNSRTPNFIQNIGKSIGFNRK